MNERLKQAQQRAIDFWNKYNRKQKSIGISIVLALIVMIVVAVVMLNRTEYVVLVDCEDASTASDVKDCLESAGITYTISDSYVVKVAKDDKVSAEMAIATDGVIAKEYTLDEALDGGMTTTESDKTKKYQAYLEDRLRVSLEQLDYVKAAKVTLTIPSSKLSVLDSDEESTAAVVLNLKGDVDKDTAENLAQWIATSLGNETTGSVTIIDTKGNMLFRGTDGEDTSVGGSSQAELMTAAQSLIETNVKKLFDEAELYQSLEVSTYLDMSFDTVERTSINYSVTDEDGDGQGPYLTSYDVSETGNSTSGGEPGTDSNDEDITYDITTSEGSTSTYDLHKYEYAVNQIIEKTDCARGTIDYDNSTLSIVARTYNVYEEKEVKKQGLLKGTTWEKFKEANKDNVEMDVDEKLYELVANATGFSQDKITIVAYRVPQFVDADTTSSSSFVDYLPIIMAVLIAALLGFVVFKSTRPIEVLEKEPELSVEALLNSTKEAQQPVEDIDLNDKSDTRIAIEKFVDENPEAVALLLRNWLEDGWD